MHQNLTELESRLWAAGGTLFVGVGDARRPIGLGPDCAVVKPPSPDGVVNWLTTHLIEALGHAAVTRVRTQSPFR